MTRAGRTAVFPQILILTAMFLFGGGGTDLPKAAEKSVEDEARRASAIAAAEQMLALRDQRAELVLGVRREFHAALAEGPIVVADLEAVLGRLDEAEPAFRKQLVGARLALREAMTRGEWDKLQKMLE